jgi:hypothetical protein
MAISPVIPLGLAVIAGIILFAGKKGAAPAPRTPSLPASPSHPSYPSSNTTPLGPSSNTTGPSYSDTSVPDTSDGSDYSDTFSDTDDSDLGAAPYVSPDGSDDSDDSGDDSDDDSGAMSADVSSGTDADDDSASGWSVGRHRHLFHARGARRHHKRHRAGCYSAGAPLTGGFAWNGSSWQPHSR